MIPLKCCCDSQPRIRTGPAPVGPLGMTQLRAAMESAFRLQLTLDFHILRHVACLLQVAVGVSMAE